MISLNPEFFLVIVIIATFAFFATIKKLLDGTGIIFSAMIGLAAYFKGGLVAFGVLLIIYAIAEAATSIAKAKGRHHQQREVGNIFGNSVPAIVGLLAGSPLAFFGASASALSDTVSSEIGSASRKKPVLITTFKPVDFGTDGGITFIGTLAGVIASFAIAFIYFITISNSLKHFGIIFACGIFGNIVDSFMGATLQRNGFLTNNQVNFIANSIAGLIAFIFENTI
jgi:uncharacterized protein (TIGR00297 family)